MDLNKIPVMDAIVKKMNWLNRRQRVIAENVANADTPGYLARDLKPSRLPADDDESITVVPVPLDQVPSMIESGEIQDAKSIASLLLALRAVDSA